MGIGKRIKEARLQKNLKQEDLAAMIGVQPSSIGNYENEVSHPKEPVLYKLFEVLEVSPNFLFQDVIKNKKILLSSEGSEVFELYNKLTPQGKQKAKTYINDILGNPSYSAIGREPGYRAVALGGRATQGDDQPPIEEKIIT